VEISDRLTKLASFYHREARKCLKGRAYLAACVMHGAALEASLHAMCFFILARDKSGKNSTMTPSMRDAPMRVSRRRPNDGIQ
jgi:hypothetical protein